jgi:2'-5' RNA ligase
MARLRTFIAVELAQGQKERLLAVQENLTRAGVGVKWVEEDNLHVTLLFLGEVDARDVVQVCQAAGNCCAGFAAFSLTLSGISGFPNPRRPRVIYAGIEEGAEELKALYAALEAALLELGCYRREARPYTPHVTLGRLRSEGGGDKLTTALAKYAGWQGGTTEVREVLVLSSELTSSGPLYTVLSRARLAGRRAGGRDTSPT